MANSISMLGSVWCAKAKLYDINDKLIGICMDTPNSIAKALMECPAATLVKCIGEVKVRSEYQDRMKDWNTAESMLRLK